MEHAVRSPMPPVRRGSPGRMEPLRRTTQYHFLRMTPLERTSFVAVGAGTPEDPRLADWKLVSGLPWTGLLVEQHIV